MSSWRHLLTAGLGRILLGKVAPPSRRQPQSLDAIADLLSDQGWTHYREDESYTIEDGIELMEAAWALSRSPDIACRLGVMYDRANRNADATPLYREALKAFPTHADLRYLTAAHVLRHGSSEDIRGFLELIGEVDPQDPFPARAGNILDAHSLWTGQIVGAIERGADGRPLVLLCYAVWGDSYIRDFLRLTCAALLAPGNLPAAAKRCSVHILVYTTAEGEAAIRGDPSFPRLTGTATMHFLHFPQGASDHADELERHHGPALGALYARNCKFLLFSTSHYATLEAGRRLGALVMPLAADGILCDGAVETMVALMEGPIDVVCVTGFRLARDKVLAEAEARFRQPDGVLQIPPTDHGELLARHLPENYFVTSPRFADFPLFLAWRVSEGAVLAHSTHFHPCCIRAAAFTGPLLPTTDPVDGRFLARRLPDLARIHLVTDASISLSDWSDNPLVEGGGTRPLAPAKVSLWLWMYWDALRERCFKAPIRMGAGADERRWAEVEGEAQALVNSIATECLRREAGNRSRSSWR